MTKGELFPELRSITRPKKGITVVGLRRVPLINRFASSRGRHSSGRHPSLHEAMCASWKATADGHLITGFDDGSFPPRSCPWLSGNWGDTEQVASMQIAAVAVNSGY